MHKVLFLVAFLVGAGTASADAVRTDQMQAFGDSRHHRIDSKAVGRAFDIFVRLPDNYSPQGTMSFPTLFILDGGLLFPMFSSYYSYLRFGEEVPEMILVGISYGTNEFEKGNTRGHDFTAPSPEREHYGGAADFQKFLKSELIPLVESTYRSRQDRRIIFGQSLGGQFVLYTALTEPGLFWGHIASNPALHRNLPFFLEMHGDGSPTLSRSRLYVSSASNDDPVFRGPAMEWMAHWSSVSAAPWDLLAETLEEHRHFSTPPASFRSGIGWLFGER